MLTFYESGSFARLPDLFIEAAYPDFMALIIKSWFLSEPRHEEADRVHIVSTVHRTCNPHLEPSEALMRGRRHPSAPAVGNELPALSVPRGIHPHTDALTVETASQRRHVHPFAAFRITQVQRICLLVNVWFPFILLVVPNVILSVIITTASGTAACASGAEFVKQLLIA